jgi:hypothetical protein
MIIGKYDHVLGPKPIYYAPAITDQAFLEKVLRDALHTKSKYITLEFDDMYAQGSKIEVDDPEARGKKQLYVVILLRDPTLPPLPILNLANIELLFLKIGREMILLDDEDVFAKFCSEISSIYIEKKEILPMEAMNIQIRGGINTIQGFCELMLDEANRNPGRPIKDVAYYLEMMLDSCKEIIKAIDEEFS